MSQQETFEEKIGEAIGLEKGAQTAINKLIEMGLLKDKHIKKILPINKEANKQENEMQKLIEEIAEDEGLDINNINSVVEETSEKAAKMMNTYLGEEPDTQEALEFLCLAEGAEVTHYEVLTSVSKKLKNRKFGTKVKNILKEEQSHLETCIKLAKQNISEI